MLLIPTQESNNVAETCFVSIIISIDAGKRPQVTNVQSVPKKVYTLRMFIINMGITMEF
jgi:hypothetical protein